MPIRTHRGRAAVYRRIWGWPMRSPAHLVGTVILVAAIIVSVGIVVPRLAGDGSGAGASPDGGQAGTASTTDTTATRGPLPTRLTEPLVSPTSAPPDPEALWVARRWATAWATHPRGMTSQQWLDRLRPYTTEEYLPRMRTVDPANIPATTVTGAPTVTASYTGSVEVQVPTDGPTLAITVIETDTGWRVARYDRVR